MENEEIKEDIKDDIKDDFKEDIKDDFKEDIRDDFKEDIKEDTKETADCEQYAEAGDFAKFSAAFLKLKAQNVFQTDQTLSDTLCRSLGLLLTAIADRTYGKRKDNADNMDNADNTDDTEKTDDTAVTDIGKIADKAFEMAKCLNPEKPGDAYTCLFKGFYKIRKGWAGYKAFCDWWGFENFSEKDFKYPDWRDEQFVPFSIGEGAYVSYARVLLKRKDKEAVGTFLPALRKYLNFHRGINAIKFVYAESLICVGDKDKALKTLLPYARKHRSDLRFWALLAETQETDSDTRLACLIRAVNCETDACYQLTGVRQELAQALIDRGDFAGAREQIRRIVNDCKEKRNRIPARTLRWTNEEWFKTPEETSGDSSRQSAVQQEDTSGDSSRQSAVPQEDAGGTSVAFDYMELTDKLLLSDLAEMKGIVYKIIKNIAYIVYGLGKKAFFNCDRQHVRINVGDYLDIHYSLKRRKGLLITESVVVLKDEIPVSDFYTVRRGTVVTRDACLSFSLKWAGGTDYIPTRLMKEGHIMVEDEVEARFVYALNPNPRKTNWIWQCLSLKRVNPQPHGNAPEVKRINPQRHGDAPEVERVNP